MTPAEIAREKAYRYAEACGLGYNAQRAQEAVDEWEQSLANAYENPETLTIQDPLKKP